jgi:hypothetical protein
MKTERKIGWVNLHYDYTTGTITSSNKPYDSEEDAATAIYVGFGIEKVACVKIEYSKKV